MFKTISMIMKSLFLVLFLCVVLFNVQGCTTKQASGISKMSVDYIMLDDAVNNLKTKINTYAVNMNTPEKEKLMATMDKMDIIQNDIKGMIAMRDFSNLSPIRIISVYSEAKAVTIDLRSLLYDEKNGFVLWNTISIEDQIQLKILNEQASNLGASIEEYFVNPENTSAIGVATDVATYGYLIYKILDIAVKAV